MSAEVKQMHTQRLQASLRDAQDKPIQGVIDLPKLNEINKVIATQAEAVKGRARFDAQIRRESNRTEVKLSMKRSEVRK